MVILCYHCPVLTIQREFVKLFPPGHLIRKKDSVSLTDPCRRIWPTSRTGYVWQGNLYYDIDRVFRLSAFFLSKRPAELRRVRTRIAYRRVIDSPLILPPSPSEEPYRLGCLEVIQVSSASTRGLATHHPLYINTISMSTTQQIDLQKRINTTDLPDKLNYKPLYYNGLASF